jgi:hypothetical protein
VIRHAITRPPSACGNETIPSTRWIHQDEIGLDLWASIGKQAELTPGRRFGPGGDPVLAVDGLDLAL